MNSELNDFLQFLGLNPLDPRAQELIRQFSQRGSQSPLLGSSSFPSDVNPPLQQFSNLPLPLVQPQTVLPPDHPSLLNRAISTVGRIRNPSIQPGESLGNKLLNIYASIKNPLGFLQQRETIRRDEEERQFRQREEARREKEFSSLEAERQSVTAKNVEQEREAREKSNKQKALENDVLSGQPQSPLGKFLVNHLGQEKAAIVVSNPELFKTVSNMDVQFSKLQAMQDKLQAQLENEKERMAIARERLEKPISSDTFQLQRIDLKPNNPYGVTSMNAFIDPKRPGLIKDLAGNRIDPKFITGVGVMKETGQEIQEIKSAQPTTFQKNRVAQAKTIIAAGDRLISDIQKNASQLGVLLGRKNILEIGVGNPDPRVRSLYTQMKSLAALQPALHGFRGLNAAKQFEEAIGNLSTNPEAVIASIRAIQNLSRDVIQPTPQDSNTSDQKIPTKRFNLSTGKIEDIP